MNLIDEEKYSKDPSYFLEDLQLVLGDVSIIKKWEILPVPINAPLCRKVCFSFPYIPSITLMLKIKSAVGVREVESTVAFELSPDPSRERA